MKVFLAVENQQDNLRHKVGIVITNNKNEMYFFKGFVSSSINETHAYLSGIMRGVSYINNNLETKEIIDIKTQDPAVFDNVAAQRALMFNEYIARHSDRITYNKSPNDKDDYFFQICRNEISFIPQHLLKQKSNSL